MIDATHNSKFVLYDTEDNTVATVENDHTDALDEAQPIRVEMNRNWLTEAEANELIKCIRKAIKADER